MSRASKVFLSLLAVSLVSASLASAQETASTARGKRLFNAYCSACHSIGGGVVVGPDLKEVTARRSVSWLKGFISEPARMVREKDSTAVKLVAEFNGYVMPTLGLSEHNIADVISYLESRAKASGQ